MKKILCVSVSALLLASATLLVGQASEKEITNQLRNLRSLSEQDRPAATAKLAAQIHALPGGPGKLHLADALSGLSTEGDAGQETIQAVADALADALKQAPVEPKKDQIPEPYLDLARLDRYEHASVSLDDPTYKKALAQLAANDADVEKADFTLKDLKGKPVTLSQLRGKVVLVNFWATWCPPCRAEMPALDAIYQRFHDQLEIVSITNEDKVKVGSFLASANYHPAVLLDANGNVAKQFHVLGIPKTFVFNREGKLTGVAIDQRSMKQFLVLLSQAGVHP